MLLNRSHIEATIAQVLQDFKDSPIDLLEKGHADAEFRYLNDKRESYVRTIQDVWGWRPADGRRPKVLEIGAFLGGLSISLARLGYDVAAFDIPEYFTNPRLQVRFQREGVQFQIGNLADYTLPYADETFDVVIMCQVLEHLNFNPLPVIQEINRVLKPNGLFYLSLPNLVAFDNRLTLLQGKSIHNPVRDFFWQLDPAVNFSVGLHWREYTGTEVREMLECLGFRVERQDYDREVSDTLTVTAAVTRMLNKKVDVIQLPGKVWRYLKYKILALVRNSVTRVFPTMRGNHTTFAVKVQSSHKEFHFTDASRPPKS